LKASVDVRSLSNFRQASFTRSRDPPPPPTAFPTRRQVLNFSFGSRLFFPPFLVRILVLFLTRDWSPPHIEALFPRGFACSTWTVAELPSSCPAPASPAPKTFELLPRRPTPSLPRDFVEKGPEAHCRDESCFLFKRVNPVSKSRRPPPYSFLNPAMDLTVICLRPRFS